MEVSIDVPSYQLSRGLRFDWDDEFEIKLDIIGNEVVIAANSAGLRSLARHMLTLAQDGVPDGHHIHLTADQELDSQVDLVIQRNDGSGVA